MPTIYDESNTPTDMALYKCDLFKNAGYGKGNNIYSKTGMVTLKNAENEEIDNEWKNYCVVDDSSKFAAAVYYHYINKEILKDAKEEDRIAYGIDLWETSSEDFLVLNTFINKLIKTKKFEFYNWSTAKNDKYINDNNVNDFDLKIGDAICRKGHVEFFIGNNKVVSWGRVHKTYILNKSFTVANDGIYSDDTEDGQKPFKTFIRLRRKNEQ